MATLILLRHGQSVWNAANKFTGWTDVELSAIGESEAAKAGEELADTEINVVHTSGLIRAQNTAEIVMQQNRVSNDVPTHRDIRLNERHYGDLQGLDKNETRAKYGDEQVHIWRRSYDVPPPGQEGESLAMCAKRTLPYLEEAIKPDLDAGKTALVAAHGNSLRSIVMEIEGLSKEEVLSLEIPTGVPRIYNYDNGVFTRV
ncbi:MAG: 2,3-bisphosphoglycerate-dependent phosphoglycerate mutase [Candidatus Thalassarchaeaceae archaeon]|nr:2,3-bisphosphoglycerate-dependent phosphoglycerate mutase [Candidatus Thalassarchaeaceae archaeon]